MTTPTSTVDNIVAKVIDFNIKYGDTFPVFKLKLTENGLPMDLSRATAFMEIKRDAADVKAALKVPFNISPVIIGEVKSTAVDVKIVPGTYIHNIKLVFPNKTVTYFAGKVIVKP